MRPALRWGMKHRKIPRAMDLAKAVCDSKSISEVQAKMGWGSRKGTQTAISNLRSALRERGVELPYFEPPKPPAPSQPSLDIVAAFVKQRCGGHTFKDETYTQRLQRIHAIVASLGLPVSTGSENHVENRPLGVYTKKAE